MKTALESGDGTGWCGDQNGTGNFAYSGVEVAKTNAEDTFEWQDKNGFRGTARISIDENCVIQAQVSTG